MRLVWHIVEKDFRRLWVPLLLWTLLLVAQSEVGVQALGGDGADLDRLYYLTIAERTLIFLALIVNMLLVAALVQEDALTGARAFWVTRPIAGGRLLVAKLLGAMLMFGAVPLLASVRWWLVCGYDATQMARATLALADTQTVTVAAALVLAVLTKNMNEFLGWLLGIAVAVIAWVFGVAMMVDGLQVEITRGANETRMVFFLAFTALGAGAVVVHQFLTRRHRRSLGIAAVAAGLLGMVFASGWDFSRWWARAPRTGPAAVQITAKAGGMTDDGRGAMNVLLRHLPPEFGATVAADNVWRWRDGTIAAAQSGFTNASWPGAAEWRALGLSSAAAARSYVAGGPEGLSGAERDGLAAALRFFVYPEKAERLRTEAATYIGDVKVALWRPELAGELPLRDGAAEARAGFSVRMSHANWRDGEWSVTVVESHPQFSAYGRLQPSIAMLQRADEEPATGYALVNRARGEAVKLWATGRHATLLAGTQQITCTTLRCAVPRDAAGDQSDAPPRWLEGATLAVVRYRAGERFEREVTIEHFGGPAEDALIR